MYDPTEELAAYYNMLRELELLLATWQLVLLKHARAAERAI